MKKVLFYAEPHPVRNYFSEFFDPAIKFFEMGSHVNFSDIEWRLFSNSYVLDEICNHFSQNEKNKSLDLFKHFNDKEIEHAISELLIYPDDDDDEKITSLLNQWSDSEIALRNGLVTGNNALSVFYESILRKIHKKFKFTHIILWSENGAVRSFCKKNNVHVLHMELGPTRIPYQETLVIDPFGTNANSSLANLELLDSDDVDSYLWASDFSKVNSLSVKEFYPSRGGVVYAENLTGNLFCTPDRVLFEQKFSDEKFKEDITFIENYVIVSLQLADDLNTINHSEFNGPKDFIEEIVPKLLALGINVCIKRHPGANQRIFNLVKELEAVEEAKKISEKVLILPANMSQKDFILFSKKSKALISINSSVCFESWIIGVPGLIFGNSIFNFNNDLKKLSEDFINGGPLINNENLIDSIKKRVSYSLNNYFIPNNNFVLSKALAKIVTECSVEERSEYLKWLRKEINIFELLLDEKIVDLNHKIGDKPGIDYYGEMAAALPNDGIYEHSIDDIKITSREVFLRGWVISKQTQPTSIFIEYAGELFIGFMVSRDDVKNHFPYAGNKPGFEIKEKPTSFDKKVDSLNLYIYGSDKKCRCITIEL